MAGRLRAAALALVAVAALLGTTTPATAGTVDPDTGCPVIVNPPEGGTQPTAYGQGEVAGPWRITNWPACSMVKAGYFHNPGSGARMTERVFLTECPPVGVVQQCSDSAWVTVPYGSYVNIDALRYNWTFWIICVNPNGAKFMPTFHLVL